MLQEVGPRQHLAGPAHELLEDGELLGRQGDRRVAPAHVPGGRVEEEVADGQHGGPGAERAPGQRPQPGEEFSELEGLGEVVVGPGVEAKDPVVDPVAGRQQQHRGPPALGPQGAADLEAVGLGDHGVEDDGVEVELPGRPERLGAVAGHVDGVALVFETAPDEGGHLGLVLHDEHPHIQQSRSAAPARPFRPLRGR